MVIAPLPKEGGRINMVRLEYFVGRSGKSEFEFIYAFKLRGAAPSDHLCSLIRYEYPKRVTITSKAPHRMA
jgi:hypothetical protein